MEQSGDIFPLSSDLSSGLFFRPGTNWCEGDLQHVGNFAAFILKGLFSIDFRTVSPAPASGSGRLEHKMSADIKKVNVFNKTFLHRLFLFLSTYPQNK